MKHKLQHGIKNGLHRGAGMAMFAATVFSAGATAPAQILDASLAGFYERGILMLNDKNYVGAADQLRRVVAVCDNEDARFWYAVASERCGDHNCIDLLEAFIADYPASEHVVEARLILADRYFFDHDYANAAKAYAAVNLDALNSAKSTLYSYRYALSLLKSSDFNEARSRFMLLNLNSSDKNYKLISQYYLAYILYVEGDYDGAYSLFSTLEPKLKQLRTDTDEYIAEDITPGYYLTQIEFRRGNYEKVIKRAATLLQSAPDAAYTAEMQRLLGESYFKTDNYSKARGYLSDYVKYAGDGTARTSLYALGVIDYENGSYTTAENEFLQVVDDRDAIAQSAYLYLGQCSAKRGDNSSAALYFDKAYRMAYDDKVSETALYDYIAALSSGGTAPFSSSIDLLERFLNTYPNSEYAPKVEEYLSAAYYNEKNYSKALASINRISNPPASALTAKQVVLYELGVQELSNGDAGSAATHLKEAVSLSKYNSRVANEAQLWLAQALYAQGKYSEAQKAGEAYLKTDKSGTNAAVATYDLAYSLYQQDKFAAAATNFEKAYNSSALPASLKPDALERAADCYYYSSNFTKAKALYSQAEKSGSGDAAYAAMRAANMEGLRGDNAKKASEMKQMIAKYPDSKWIPEAMMELASAYAAQGKNSDAITAYSNVVSKYPSAQQARQAQLQVATLYAKNGDTANAIEACETLIERWPSSEEAATANIDLRNMMGQRGDLAEYVAFINSVPGAPKIDVNEIESLAFETAENQWIQNLNVVAPLEKYVSDYPDGAYLAQALADLSTSYNESGAYDKALSCIDKLLARRGSSQQAPEAMMLKAEILEAHYPSRTADALAIYRTLAQSGDTAYLPEAYLGIARLASSPSDRYNYANAAMNAGGLDSTQLEEAQYLKASAAIDLNRNDEGVAILSDLAKSPASLNGAKSAVALGQYYLNRKEYAKAQKVLLEFTNEGTPHQYWLARGYIALADAYTGLGKKSTAREYLTSLRDNYPGTEEDIRKMIKERL